MAPVKAPVVAPVKKPVTTPLKVPVTAPVKAPVTTPIKTPVKTPAHAPASPSIKAPVFVPAKTPIREPHAVPVITPNKSPSNICGPVVSAFTLVDAEIGKDIMPLGDFMLTNKTLNIRVEFDTCSHKAVDSVLMNLDGKRRCEQYKPYAVFGDSNMVDVNNDVAQYFGKFCRFGKACDQGYPLYRT
jgi:hypothetical protein